MEKNVMRLAAVQHLRSAYGIKTKNWNKNKASSCNKPTTSHSTKVFGVPLDSLPYYNVGSGRVPRFLVDACMKLQAHIETEGLFRKSGSVIRMKEHRAKLDAREECLSTAFPCDVAGLVKQFFRELPEPVLPAELQDAFFKAQQLPTEEERTSATLLLSCVLPERNEFSLSIFRSADNKMDSSNLSVILAPNLLHSGDGTEKMNSHTEKRLKLQAAIVQRFIENAPSFGVLPQFLQEKVPAMMGCDGGSTSPTSQEDLEELDVNSKMKRGNGRSFGDMVCGALNKVKSNRSPACVIQDEHVVLAPVTPVIATPSSKRKLPSETRHSFGFSNKKRRSVKKNLGIELLPNMFFSGTSTPGSAHSSSGVLDSSQDILSSATRSNKRAASSARRKSKRLLSRHVVTRVESGRAGCFSPKAGKKEAPLKSLRSRFSLGKSSKDSGSESIGWRLAMQESTTSFGFTKASGFTPSILATNTEPKGSRFISKSEDNLLTPRCGPGAHRASWCEETPGEIQLFHGGSFTDTPVNTRLKSSYASEPAIVVSEPSPAVTTLTKKLCCASSVESLPTEHVEPALVTSWDGTGPSDGLPVSTPASSVMNALPPDPPATEENTFSQFEMAALSPLHIDSVDFESCPHCTPAGNRGYSSPVHSHNDFVVRSVERITKPMDCSRLIEALDVQSPAAFTLNISGVQSTPFRMGAQLKDVPETNQCSKSPGTVHSNHGVCTKAHAKPPSSPPEVEKRRVAEHIQHFNKLTLCSPKNAKSRPIRSPLRFQRTPVRLTVRRINSLQGDCRRPRKSAEPADSQSSRMGKAVSLESGLSPHAQPPSCSAAKKPPPVPPKRRSTLVCHPAPCALGDVTNKVQPKVKLECAATNLPQMIGEKDQSHYRGSPRNPLNLGKLLSATKPVDF